MPTLRSFDLNLLVLFDALYRERQLSAAASAVGMSQPAASQALGRLRDAFDDELFIRRGRGMEPTPQAEVLAPTVREALRMIEEKLRAMTKFDPARSDREFSIGLAEIGETFFPRFLANVSRHAPRIRLRSVTGRHGDVQAATLRREVDLAFDFEPASHPSLRDRALGSDEIVVIARRGHPRVNGVVTLEHFLSEQRVRIDFATDRWKRLLALIGAPEVERGIVATVSHMASIPSIVAETDAVSIVPRSLATMPEYVDRLQILATPIPLRPLPLFAIWHESNEADPGHEWLRRFLTERFWAP